MIVFPFHPRRNGIGYALARAIPMPREDRETRHLLRRADIGEAIRR